VDETRFDALTRIIGQEEGVPRRVAVKAVTSALVVGVATVISTRHIDEVAAREGAADGLLGGRRGKDQRGRDKNRGKNNRKNRGRGGKAPGGQFVGKTIDLILENLTQRSIDFQGVIPLDVCATRYLETVAPTLAPTWSSGFQQPSVWIDDKILVTVTDQSPNRGFPYYEVYLGGEFTPGDPNQCHIPNRNSPCNFYSGVVQMNVGQKKVVRTKNACGPGIEIWREGDTSDARVFRIRVIE
jgi:hypothetical protein